LFDGSAMLACWLAGLLAGWLAGLLACWLACWLAGAALVTDTGFLVSGRCGVVANRRQAASQKMVSGFCASSANGYIAICSFELQPDQTLDSAPGAGITLA
jgi:hypothetical protein